MEPSATVSLHYTDGVEDYDDQSIEPGSASEVSPRTGYDYNGPRIEYCQKELSDDDHYEYGPEEKGSNLGYKDPTTCYDDSTCDSAGVIPYAQNYDYGYEEGSYRCSSTEGENVYAVTAEYEEEYEEIEADHDPNFLQQLYVTFDGGKTNDGAQALEKFRQPTSRLGAILNPHQLLFRWKSEVPWACQTTLRTWSRVLSAKIAAQFCVTSSGNTATASFLRRTLKDYCLRAPNTITANDLLPKDFLHNVQSIFDMGKHKPARRKGIIGVSCFPIHMSVRKSTWKDLTILHSITSSKGKKESFLASPDASGDRVGQIQHAVVSWYSKKYSIPEKSLTAFVADTGPNFRSMHTSMFAKTALSSLAKSGQSILLPKPSHPTLSVWFNVFQYSTGVTLRHYRRHPERGWLLDFGDLQKKFDDTVAAVFLSNPSVVCGGVSSYRELSILVEMLEKRGIPLVVEENMDYLVYDQENQSHSVLELKPKIPVIVVNSSYRWMMFGAEGPCLAWAVIYDPESRLNPEVLNSLETLQRQSTSQPSSLPPPTVLSNFLHYDGWTNDIVRYLAKNMAIASGMLGGAPGLTVAPQKAGYFLVVLINFDQFQGKLSNDTDFAAALFNQESVKVVCGSVLLGWKDSFAIELYMRRDLLIEACDRIDRFCRLFVVRASK